MLWPNEPWPQRRSAFTNREKLELHQTHALFKRCCPENWTQPELQLCAPKVLNACCLTDEIIFNKDWQHLSILLEILDTQGIMKLIQAIDVIT